MLGSKCYRLYTVLGPAAVHYGSHLEELINTLLPKCAEQGVKIEFLGGIFVECGNRYQTVLLQSDRPFKIDLKYDALASAQHKIIEWYEIEFTDDVPPPTN